MSRSTPVTLPTRGRHDGLILTLLRSGEALSRSAISDITGLSPTTVTKAVTPLISKGYIKESSPEAESRIGRPAIGLRLVPEAVEVCGIQIGVGTARAGLVDALGRTHDVRTWTFDPSAPAEAVMKQIAERVREDLLPLAASELIGIGIGAAGAVDTTNRVNLMSLNLGWNDVPMATISEETCGLPTVVEHNVRAMALAENRFGHGARSIAFVYVKTGVGLGLVLHDEPFLCGEHGVSELGHIQVVSEGEKCACGAHGCLETIVAEPALRRNLSRLGVKDAGELLNALEDAATTDKDVADLRDSVLRHLSTGLAAVANLLNPTLIVVGGLLAEAPEPFLHDLTERTRDRVFPLLRDSLSLKRTSFDTPGIVGAAASAFETFYYGPPPSELPAGRGRGAPRLG
ncbi:ROK family transcriptional regulator [Saccharopolyspora sp. NPDC003752]